MSVPKQDHQATFYDATFLAQDLFGPRDRYEIFRQKVLPALQDMRGDLCQLYCSDNGRPGIEPVVMAGVTLLQFIDNVPDRKATENARLHLGWKHALNLRINDPGFHATSLVTFRNRRADEKDGRLIFDGILQALHAAGLVKRKGKQRLDSTHLLGAVAQMGRLEVVRETTRLFLETVQRMNLQGHFNDWAVFYERYIDSDINARRPAAGGVHWLWVSITIICSSVAGKCKRRLSKKPCTSVMALKAPSVSLPGTVADAHVTVDSTKRPCVIIFMAPRSM